MESTLHIATCAYPITKFFLLTSQLVIMALGFLRHFPLVAQTCIVLLSRPNRLDLLQVVLGCSMYTVIYWLLSFSMLSYIE